MLKVRKAEIRDLDEIMVIYDRAGKYMAENGNPNQWVNGYPGRELVKADIENGISFVAEDSQGIEAVFVFFVGEDSTYRIIEHGNWLNDEPYGTIHRIASAGKRKKVAAECFAWCAAQCRNLRIDTHEDNKIMQHLLEKNGFTKCGIIYLATGAPRLAYQK